MKRIILAALIATIIPALAAASPGVDLAWDQPNDPDNIVIDGGETPTYSVLTTTAVDLGNTNVEDKQITITLVNTTGNPETLTTLLNESIPDDQLCFPEGCQDEYLDDIPPSEYQSTGDFQVVTKVTQVVNGVQEATTQTAQFTAESRGELNIDYISCNDVVIQNKSQYCTTQVTDQNGNGVSNAAFTLSYQDGETLGTCQTNQDGFCAVEPTINKPAGDYTVDGTATKQFWQPDNDGQPTDTFTVLTKKYTIENLETWADDFQTTTDEYFRSDTPRASFDVRNDATGELLGPEDNIVTDVTLRVYDNNKAGGAPIKTENLEPITDPVPEPGAFQFTLDQIPLSDDYLGQGKIFAFAINYTDSSGGQASKIVTIKNNPLTFAPINDQTIPAGETREIDLTNTINDLETPDDEIQVTFSNTGPYTIQETSPLTYEITAPSDDAQQTISVEANDTDGSTKTRSFTATTNQLIPPTADYTFTPNNPVVGQTVTLTSNSTDEDGTIESYEWTFNGPKSKQTGEQIQVSFNQPGDYDVTLTVTDNDGLTDTVTKTITVADDNNAPNANFTFDPEDPITGEYVTFTSTSTDNDGFITQTNWTVTGPNTDLTINGQDEFATQFNQPGDYHVTITVQDNDGATDTRTKTVTIDQANRAPSLDTIPDQNTPEGDQYQYQAAASDPDGDTLSWGLTGPDFLTIDQSGQITGTPGFDDAGDYTVDITVSDGALSDTETYTLTVTDENRAPQASFQFQPSNPTVGETVTFTATSTDPDGDDLTHEWGFDNDGQTDATGEQVTYTFDQAGNQPVTLTSSDGSLTDTTTRTVQVGEAPNTPPVAQFDYTPTNPDTSETVTFDATQSFDEDGEIVSYEWFLDNAQIGSGETTTYTFNEPGTYDITLRVTDDDGATNQTTQTVPVDQANRAPSIQDIQDQTTPENQIYTYQAQASDPDGDTLSWSVNGASFLSINENGLISGTPGFDDAGTYTVTVSVNDSDLTDSETYTLIVTDVNRNPVLDPINDQQVMRGNTVTVDADATDPDSDTITYNIDTDQGTFNTQTGEWTWTPQQTGTYTYTITANDGRGGTDQETFTVTVTEQPNTPPQAFFTADPANPVTGETVDLDATQSFDEDGEIISYEWTYNGQEQTGEQIQVSFDEPGSYDVTLTVTDDDGATNTTTNTVTVDQANRAPDASFTFEPTNPLTGETVTFTATSTDPDGDTLSHQWDFNGDGIVDATGEQVTNVFDEPGSYNVSLTSSDGSLSDTATRTVEVELANQAPTAAFTISPNQTFVVGDNATLTSESFDTDGTIENYKWTVEQPNNITVERNNSNLTSITQVFLVSGDYTVTHTVTDDDSAVDATTKTITVGSGSRPVARIDAPRKATKGQTVELDASRSTDSDGFIDTYQWTVTVRDTVVANKTTSTPILDYTPKSTGTYDVSVTVTDSDGLSDTATASTTVEKERVTVEPDTEVSLGQYGVYSDAGFGVIRHGEPFTVRSGVSNDGPQQAENLRLTFTIPEYGYERNGQLFDSARGGGNTRQIQAYLPSYIPSGDYTGYVRVFGDDVHRQKTVPITVTR